MDEYIDKSALYEKITQLEELARNRYLDTPSNSPCYSRYMAQFNERTAFKHIIADFSSADVAPVVHGQWIEYTKVIIPEPYNKWEQAWKCSECGFDDGFAAYNYCPNCGAKMDGGND